MRVSENRGPQYRTLNSRILIIRTPKQSTPQFSETPILEQSRAPATPGILSSVSSKLRQMATDVVNVLFPSDFVGSDHHPAGDVPQTARACFES